jgi:hypothetical protein
LGYSKTLRQVHPVQNIIAEGEPIADKVLAQNEARVRGMRKGEERFILVTDYQLTGPKQVSVTVPVKCKALTAVDLASGKQVATLDPGSEPGGDGNDEAVAESNQQFEVQLSPDRRVRGLHLTARD